MTSIFEDTDRYERWLRGQCDVVDKGLKEKHKRMRESAFIFLRASYFRWALTIDTVCPGNSDAPKVVSVGDIHIENFGTWRDAEGRTVWGVNDFDEAAVMPYPHDLIRLATSALLAPGIRLSAGAIARAILDGYEAGLASPRPVLLDQCDPWLRKQVALLNDKSASFWRAIEKLKTTEVPSAVRSALTSSLPVPEIPILRYCRLQKGGGSLGRPRYLAVGEWQGGKVVREAKALVPSAWDWARGAGRRRTRFLSLATGRFRSPDASLRIENRFVVRRVSPDSRKLELKDLAACGLGGPLLRAMGHELGAIHAGHRNAPRVKEDLAGRRGRWLLEAALVAERAVRKDYAIWKRDERHNH